MVASFNYTPNKRNPLSEAEYNLLADMLGKGVRAGFYMAYYAMTGNVEALLTAKVSRFSGRKRLSPVSLRWLSPWARQMLDRTDRMVR
jgi:hypothetical protein